MPTSAKNFGVTELELTGLLVNIHGFMQLLCKYQKGSEMHTSDALSRLHNLTDTPDNKDVIPLNFLQHFTPNYIEHVYLHWVENLYVQKTKDCDTTQVKRKHGRPPKQKIGQDETQNPAANTHTTQPRQANKNSRNEIIFWYLIDKVNEE